MSPLFVSCVAGGGMPLRAKPTERQYELTAPAPPRLANPISWTHSGAAADENVAGHLCGGPAQADQRAGETSAAEVKARLASAAMRRTHQRAYIGANNAPRPLPIRFPGRS